MTPDGPQRGRCSPASPYTAPELPRPIRELPFPIVAWHGVPRETLEPDRFETLAGAGFTINFTAKGNEAQNLRILDLAAAVGVKALLGDYRLEADRPFDPEMVETVVSAYREHPALFGYIIREEPPMQSFDAMARYRDAIHELDSDAVVYTNIYPAYAWPEWTGAADYAEYLSAFMDVFQPALLSSAYYPFHHRGFRGEYFEAMGRIRSASLDAGIPFWAFAMVAWIEPEFPKPRESWIRFQVFSGLAHGASGIEIFPYALPESPTEDFRSAILDSAGEPAPMYDLVRGINQEVLALAPVLRGLRSIRVCVAPRPFGDPSVDWPAGLLSATRGLQVLVGQLRGASGEEYLFLVSLDFDAAGEVRLRLAAPWSRLTEIDKGTGEPLPFPSDDAGEATVTLQPGDGRLFRVE